MERSGLLSRLARPDRSAGQTSPARDLLPLRRCLGELGAHLQRGWHQILAGGIGRQLARAAQGHDLSKNEPVAITEIGAEAHACARFAIGQFGGEAVVLLLSAPPILALEQLADSLLVTHQVCLVLAN